MQTYVKHSENLSMFEISEKESESEEGVDKITHIKCQKVGLLKPGLPQKTKEQS